MFGRPKVTFHIDVNHKLILTNIADVNSRNAPVYRQIAFIFRVGSCVNKYVKEDMRKGYLDFWLFLAAVYIYCL